MDDDCSDKLSVYDERHYTAFHAIKGAANMCLKAAQRRDAGWLYNQMIALTFYAMSFEALFNAVGNRLFEDWIEKYERMNSTEKLILLATNQNIKVDFNEEPWSSVRWVFSYRNDIVHAKPKLLTKHSVMTQASFDKREGLYPVSMTEKLSTLKNAERCKKALYAVRDTFIKNMNIDDLEGILSDGCTSVGTPIFEHSGKKTQ